MLSPAESNTTMELKRPNPDSTLDKPKSPI